GAGVDGTAGGGGGGGRGGAGRAECIGGPPVVEPPATAVPRPQRHRRRLIFRMSRMLPPRSSGRFRAEGPASWPDYGDRPESIANPTRFWRVRPSHRPPHRRGRASHEAVLDMYRYPRSAWPPSPAQSPHRRSS